MRLKALFVGLSLGLAIFGNQNLWADEQSTAPASFSRLGISYFSFFAGPGFTQATGTYSPNQLGRPSDDGVNFFNLISFKYRFSKSLALDLQTRHTLILNNGTENPEFSAFRWESPRVGLSGTLASGETWSLSGAVNTDFPYFMPEPFSGYTARARTVLFNPGMFASFSYRPKGSRFSIGGVLAPRMFFYSDRTAGEAQLLSGGLSAGNKPELVVAVLPTLNYSLAEKLELSLGATLDYRKQVLSDWNPFQASLASNGDSTAWRFMAMPLSLGLTYTASSAFTIFPFVQVFPIAAQRVNAKTGAQADLLETASVGMWISGALL